MVKPQLTWHVLRPQLTWQRSRCVPAAPRHQQTMWQPVGSHRAVFHCVLCQFPAAKPCSTRLPVQLGAASAAACGHALVRGKTQAAV